MSTIISLNLDLFLSMFYYKQITMHMNYSQIMSPCPPLPRKVGGGHDPPAPMGAPPLPLGDPRRNIAITFDTEKLFCLKKTGPLRYSTR